MASESSSALGNSKPATAKISSVSKESAQPVVQELKITSNEGSKLPTVVPTLIPSSLPISKALEIPSIPKDPIISKDVDSIDPLLEKSSHQKSIETTIIPTSDRDEISMELDSPPVELAVQSVKEEINTATVQSEVVDMDIESDDIGFDEDVPHKQPITIATSAGHVPATKPIEIDRNQVPSNIYRGAATSFFSKSDSLQSEVYSTS
jgi:hypothetical protein